MEVGPAANQFAYIALLSWPAICVILFVMLPIEAAAIWSMLGAQLLLPAYLKLELPLLPPLDRMSIAAISAFVLCWMKGGGSKARAPSIFIVLLGIAFVIAPILTSLTNSYELQTAAGSIPGFYPLDGFKVAFRQAVALLPMIVGMRFLSSDHGRSLLLKSLAAAVLVYSLPMLFEIRFSPQLHRWVYGYHPTEFLQQMRAGGFRPVVFVGHGLELALLTCLAFTAAVILARGKWRILRVPAGAASGYLGILLLLCKSLAAVMYAAATLPLVLFTRPRTWTKIACALLLLVCAYPALRGNGLVPVEAISNVASSISGDRSQSFDTRIQNERQLLAKANEKPFLGWGTWGRNRVYDRDTGKDISITDGQWIIQFGMYGWFGYLSMFGLLAAAAFGAYRAVDEKVTPASLTLGGLALILGIDVIDMIPNASTMSLTFLIAGSVATSARARRAAAPKKMMSDGRASVPAPKTQVAT